MRTFAAIAFAVVSLSAVAFQENSTPDKVVQRIYVGPNNERVEGLGACDLNASDVSCWDMDGRKDSGLEDQMKAYLLANSNDISFKFRKKNRYLAVKKSPNNSISFTQAAGTYINRQFSSGDDRPQFLSISVEPNVATASVLLTIQQTNAAPEVVIPFKEGVQRAGNIELTIGKAAVSDVRTMPNRYYMQPNSDGSAFKAWSVPLQLSAAHVVKRASTYLMPLDAAKNPIQYVDKKGDPVSGVKYLESVRNTANQSGYPGVSKDYAQVVFGGGYATPNQAVLYQTNVNPSKIAYVTAKTSSSELVLIEGFPLDPR